MFAGLYLVIACSSTGGGRNWSRGFRDNSVLSLELTYCSSESDSDFILPGSEINLEAPL